MHQSQTPSFKETLDGLQSRLASKQADLSDIVEALGPQLTAKESETRERGTLLLAHVLDSYAVTNALTRKHIDLLVTFFCDRLRDVPCIPAVLEGLTNLASLLSLEQPDVASILRALFTEVHIPSLLQSSRYSALSLVRLLATKYLPQSKSLGADFVYGVIQAIDGEKDPRNLLVAFELHQLCVHHFPFELFLDELAEVVIVYFPITFTPPPNDPHGITKDMLVKGLRSCFLTSSLFAPHILPTVLEKLDSSSRDAKIQALATIAECARVYGRAGFGPFVLDVGSQLRNEMFHTGDEDVEKAILETITSIVLMLSGGVRVIGSVSEKLALSPNSPFMVFMEPMLSECQFHLKEPELKLAHPAARLLQAAEIASDVASVFVLSKTVPLLIEQYAKLAETNAKRSLVEILIGFLKAAKDFASQAKHPLAPFGASLLRIFLESTSALNGGLRCAGVTGLVGLIISPDVISSSVVAECLDQFFTLAINDSEHVVRQQAVSALAVVSTSHAVLVKQHLLPKLAATIAGATLPSNGASTLKAKQQSWSLLTEMSSTPEMLEATAPLFLGYLQLNKHLFLSSTDPSQKSAPGSSATNALLGEPLAEFAMVLSSVAAIVSAGLRNDKLGAELLASVWLGGLSSLHDQVLAHALDQSLADFDVRSLETLVNIVRDIVCALGSDSSHLTVLVKTQVRTLVSAFEALSSSEMALESNILDPNASLAHSRRLGFVCAVVCCCRMETIQPFLPQLEPLLGASLDVSIRSPDSHTAQYAAHLAAGLLNKLQNPDASSKAIISQLLEETSKLSPSSPASFKAVVSACAWICKALYIRGHTDGSRLAALIFSNFLTASLDGPVCIPQLASDAVAVIMADSVPVLNKKVHANYRIMYKQRFFTEFVPVLVKGYNESSDDHKQFYLSTLSHILQNVPKQILLEELPPLLPLILQSLSHQNAGLRLSTANTLFVLLFDAPDLFAPHCATLTKQLLQLSTSPDSMKLRMAALQCIGLMASTLPAHVTYPHRGLVTSYLAKAVDDKKRLVRQEAVKARNEWFLLSSGTK